MKKEFAETIQLCETLAKEKVVELLGCDLNSSHKSSWFHF